MAGSEYYDEDKNGSRVEQLNPRDKSFYTSPYMSKSWALSLEPTRTYGAGDPPPDYSTSVPIATEVVTGTSISSKNYGIELPGTVNSTPVPYKYDEARLLDEVATYVKNTYKGHYVGEDNIQALDLIFAAGHGDGFAIASILKYASRYGKKKGFNRDDILKVVHYGILLLYLNDKNHKE